MYSIALTILILDIDIPIFKEEVNFIDILAVRMPGFIGFIGFIVSFFVIALFWQAHLRNMSYAKKVDNRLLFYNIFNLFFIDIQIV